MKQAIAAYLTAFPDFHVTKQALIAEGGLVHTLDLGRREAGFYLGRTQAAYWDGLNSAGEKVASGFYFYQIKAGDFSALRRMVIVK